MALSVELCTKYAELLLNLKTAWQKRSDITTKLDTTRTAMNTTRTAVDDISKTLAYYHKLECDIKAHSSYTTQLLLQLTNAYDSYERTMYNRATYIEYVQYRDKLAMMQTKLEAEFDTQCHTIFMERTLMTNLDRQLTTIAENEQYLRDANIECNLASDALADFITLHPHITEATVIVDASTQVDATTIVNASTDAPTQVDATTIVNASTDAPTQVDATTIVNALDSDETAEQHTITSDESQSDSDILKNPDNCTCYIQIGHCTIYSDDYDACIHNDSTVTYYTGDYCHVHIASNYPAPVRHTDLHISTGMYSYISIPISGTQFTMEPNTIVLHIRTANNTKFQLVFRYLYDIDALYANVVGNMLSVHSSSKKYTDLLEQLKSTVDSEFTKLQTDLTAMLTDFSKK
jgi:hypothetical protein